MDGPECAADAGAMTERRPVGEGCRLRGVPLRWRGGELEAAILLRALPAEEALCRVGSRAVGYLAYCWMIIGEVASSGRSG